MSITITIFATLLTILVACNALITQAIKVAFDKREKKYSSNLIALITSIAIGGLGSIIAYIFLGIEFNPSEGANISFYRKNNEGTSWQVEYDIYDPNKHLI